MKGLLSKVKRELLSLYRDEQGADMVEYVLIVAAVALPLLAVIIWFWHDITGWLDTAWTTIKGGGETNPGDIQHNN